MVAAVTACLAVSACVPMKVTGYQPSGPGTLESGYCVAWIKDILRMPGPSGVDVVFSAGMNDPDGTLELNIGVSVPEGVHARFLADELLLQSPDWQQEKRLRVLAITGGTGQVGPMAVLHGSGEPSLGNFVLWFEPVGKGNLMRTAIATVTMFTLQLPPMDINGERFQPEVIRFEAYRKWGMYYCVQ